MSKNAEENVLIFDTTLRDGEQSAGTAMTVEEKLVIARQLERLGVDILEAGFPVSSPGDFEAVQNISKEITTPVIAALARAVSSDVDRAWEAIKTAKKPRIHVFLSSSEVHALHLLRKDRNSVMRMAVDNVARAKDYCENIEFSPMDATRTDPEYLCQLLHAVIEAGATTVNIADTVGYAIPSDFVKLLNYIQTQVPSIGKSVVLSVHCHNDLGLAVANSLAAVETGARQVEGCINGIGERAGNAALEEVIMGIRTRKDLFKLTTNIDTTQLYPTSALVSDITGFSVQPNKAIIGSNAFRHASGIHQDGLLKDKSTYEIMNPTDIGILGSELVLGKLSGRHGLQSRLNELGYYPTDQELIRIFESFKNLADKKREVTDRDLVALMNNQRKGFEEAYTLEHVQVSCGDHEVPTATVSLKYGKTVKTEAATGTGPVDAVCQAINRIIGVPNVLSEFHVRSVTQGIDAVGEVTIRVKKDEDQYIGHGADTDIIVASAKAYMNALNRLIAMEDISDIKPIKNTTKNK